MQEKAGKLAELINANNNRLLDVVKKLASRTSLLLRVRLESRSRVHCTPHRESACFPNLGTDVGRKKCVLGCVNSRPKSIDFAEPTGKFAKPCGCAARFRSKYLLLQRPRPSGSRCRSG